MLSSHKLFSHLDSSHSLTTHHIVIVPGWNNSGPTHWQSRWAEHLPNASRVQQKNWSNPTRESWVEQLQQHIEQSPGPVLLVAHSLGCVTVAHWASRYFNSKVKGALLVAPADVERPNAPVPLQDFAPIPRERLPFRVHVVASDNDPYCRSLRALEFASQWAANYSLLKKAGHINADTPLGLWKEGLGWLSDLARPANQQDVA